MREGCWGVCGWFELRAAQYAQCVYLQVLHADQGTSLASLASVHVDEYIDDERMCVHSYLVCRGAC